MTLSCSPYSIKAFIVSYRNFPITITAPSLRAFNIARSKIFRICLAFWSLSSSLCEIVAVWTPVFTTSALTVPNALGKSTKPWPVDFKSYQFILKITFQHPPSSSFIPKRVCLHSIFHANSIAFLVVSQRFTGTRWKCIDYCVSVSDRFKITTFTFADYFSIHNFDNDTS